MGRYYRIVNATKQEIVYGYWKNDGICSVYQVMHQFNWDPNDEIFSLGGEEACNFKYDEKRRCLFTENKSYLDTSDGEEEEVFESYDIDTFTAYKYNFKLDEEVGWHIPKFDENYVCIRCKYRFLEANKTLATEEDMIWK